MEKLHPATIWVVLFAIWVGFGILAAFYLHSRASVEARRSVARLIIISSGVLLCGAMIAVTVVQKRSPDLLYIVIPFVAFVTWGNLKQMRFCPHCSAFDGRRPGNRTDSCPKCGAKLEKTAL